MSAFKKSIWFIHGSRGRTLSLFASLCVIGSLLIGYFTDKTNGVPIADWQIVLCIAIGCFSLIIGFSVAFSKKKGG